MAQGSVKYLTASTLLKDSRTVVYSVSAAVVGASLTGTFRLHNDATGSGGGTSLNISLALAGPTSGGNPFTQNYGDQGVPFGSGLYVHISGTVAVSLHVG